MAGDELQFDRAIDATDESSATGAQLFCNGCNSIIETQYFQIADRVACLQCKEKVEEVLQRAQAEARRSSGIVRAAGLGLGAAIAGAILYYAVMAITGYEFALVTILIGYMVGWAVRKGARVGARRYQLLAVGLTYLAVGLAYTPLAINAAMEAEPGSTAAADSAAVKSAGDTIAPQTAAVNQAGADTVAAPVSGGNLALGLGAIVLFSLMLPVLSMVGSFPGGILSAVIIGVGLMQAWRMTGAPGLQVLGPFEVGNTTGARPGA